MGAADVIHPTALVDAKARLGAGVTIGAFAIVGAAVTLADGVEIGHHAILEGRVEIGAGARIGHGAIIGGEPQDFKFKPGTPSGVRIGAGTIVREYATIHRASHDEAWTEIGPECLIMALSHVAHDCRLGRRVIVINYAGITGHCEIGDFATIGGYAGIVPFTRVGAYAYVGGCSKLTADLPPFMIAEGTPATVRAVNVVGMRRAGIPPADRRLVRDAYRILYRSGVAPGRGLERLRTEIPAAPVRDMLIDFLAGTRRGLCPPAGGWAGSASRVVDAEIEGV